MIFLRQDIGMIKLVHDIMRRLRILFARPEGRQELDRRTGNSDPLSHPALQKMTLRELADLPFDRTQIAGRAEQDSDRRAAQ